MEVHHHTPAAPIATGRKKWNHYLWEFLMLFLAVFCGFLAENQREHIVEGKRAKEYAALLLQDLNNDSVYVSRFLVNQKSLLQHSDSLLAILSSGQFNKNNYGIVYHFNHTATLADFKPAFPVNFEQLINSGSLRYFKNKTLVSSFSSLDRLLKTTSEVYTGYNDFIRENLTPFSINHLNTLQYDIFSRTVLVPNPDIYEWNKKEAVLLANKINLKKTYDVFFINYFLKECMEKISTLITGIKKEYKIN